MSDPRCVVVVTEWIPEAVWVVAQKHGEMLAAFTDQALKQIPTGWEPDAMAHHGPVHTNSAGQRGVMMVLRGWRLAPTKSGTCDGTCQDCACPDFDEDGFLR